MNKKHKRNAKHARKHGRNHNREAYQKIEPLEGVVQLTSEKYEVEPVKGKAAQIAKKKANK